MIALPFARVSFATCLLCACVTVYIFCHVTLSLFFSLSLNICPCFCLHFKKLSACPMKTFETRYLIRYTKSNYIFNMTNVKIRLGFFLLHVILLLLLLLLLLYILMQPLLLLFRSCWLLYICMTMYRKFELLNMNTPLDFLFCRWFNFDYFRSITKFRTFLNPYFGKSSRSFSVYVTRLHRANMEKKIAKWKSDCVQIEWMECRFV